MIPYWLLFSYFALGGLVGQARSGNSAPRRDPFILFGAILIALMIGFRYKVGTDWPTYERLFKMASYMRLDRMIGMGDPAYQLLNWAAYHATREIWLVNLVCGLVFSWGLFRLAKIQPQPWLAMLVAIPYLVIVVAMGLSRQAVAIGILMAGLADMFRGGSFTKFSIYVAAAGLFHRTAVLVLPLAVFGSQRRNLVNLFVLAAMGILLFDFILASHIDSLMKGYIETKYSSQGAAIRIAMSVIPAVLFVLFRKRLEFTPLEASIWRNFSLASFGLLILLFVLPSSTAVDRMALYVLPLQVAVLSRMPSLLRSPLVGRVAVIGYAFAVLFVWLNYADHSIDWIPYRFYPVG